MSKMIEEHIYYLEICPLTKCKISSFLCYSCKYYIRQIEKANALHPGALEHERIVCTYEHPAQGSLIPV
jgi:hypothetical protein